MRFVGWLDYVVSVCIISCCDIFMCSELVISLLSRKICFGCSVCY